MHFSKETLVQVNDGGANGIWRDYLRRGGEIPRRYFYIRPGMQLRVCVSEG